MNDNEKQLAEEVANILLALFGLFILFTLSTCT
jgi:hypothetical protein